jgi:hypothetical protein
LHPGAQALEIGMLCGALDTSVFVALNSGALETAVRLLRVTKCRGKRACETMARSLL